MPVPVITADNGLHLRMRVCVCVCLSSRSDPIRLLPSRRRWRDSGVSQRQRPWCVPHTLCPLATTLLSADVHLLNGKHTHIAHCKKKPCRIRVGTRQQGKAGKGKKKDKGKESGEEVVHDDDYDDDYDDDAADGNKATKEREGGKASERWEIVIPEEGSRAFKAPQRWGPLIEG